MRTGVCFIDKISCLVTLGRDWLRPGDWSWRTKRTSRVSTMSCSNIAPTVFDGTMSWEEWRIYKIRKKITIKSIVRFYCVEKDALTNTRLALFEGVSGKRKSCFIEQKSILLCTLSRNNINLACSKPSICFHFIYKFSDNWVVWTVNGLKICWTFLECSNLSPCTCLVKYFKWR